MTIQFALRQLYKFQLFNTLNSNRVLRTPLFIINFAICYLFTLSAGAQKFIDPCFKSIPKPGTFYTSAYLRNFVYKFELNAASDMLEWNGEKWEGQQPYCNLTIVPPDTCSVRAIWMGCMGWTGGGEGFGLKLDAPMTKGNVYTFTYTYASDGTTSDGNFQPVVYTAIGDRPLLVDAVKVGRMPAAGRAWKTDSISIAITDQNNNHNWVILHAVESSGIVLSDCAVHKSLAMSDSAKLCSGKILTVTAPASPEYKYRWSTGDTTNTISIDHDGTYYVDITNFKCIDRKIVVVEYSDCELRLTMPNVFTPNSDFKNDIFKPFDDINFIKSGILTIYNRWGETVFTGDYRQGWNGEIKNKPAANGIYYYDVAALRLDRKIDHIKGSVHLIGSN